LHPGENLTQENSVADPDPEFYPSRILDPGYKFPDLGYQRIMDFLQNKLSLKTLKNMSFKRF
jgi:hypothetical protein